MVALCVICSRAPAECGPSPHASLKQHLDQSPDLGPKVQRPHATYQYLGVWHCWGVCDMAPHAYQLTAKHPPMVHYYLECTWCPTVKHLYVVTTLSTDTRSYRRECRVGATCRVLVQHGERAPCLRGSACERCGQGTTHDAANTGQAAGGTDISTHGGSAVCTAYEAGGCTVGRKAEYAVSLRAQPAASASEKLLSVTIAG